MPEEWRAGRSPAASTLTDQLCRLRRFRDPPPPVSAIRAVYGFDVLTGHQRRQRQHLSGRPPHRHRREGVNDQLRIADRRGDQRIPGRASSYAIDSFPGASSGGFGEATKRVQLHVRAHRDEDHVWLEHRLLIRVGQERATGARPHGEQQNSGCLG
jgi:hypothetical protein